MFTVVAGSHRLSVDSSELAGTIAKAMNVRFNTGKTKVVHSNEACYHSIEIEHVNGDVHVYIEGDVEQVGPIMDAVHFLVKCSVIEEHDINEDDLTYSYFCYRG